VEIPTATPWAELEGAAEIDTGKFPALAQFDFYMNVQKHYSGHNTSATLELTEAEIEPLATAIHTAIDTDQGYISAALLARFEDKETFPRMPFEPISKERYEALCAEVEQRRTNDCFFEALAHFDSKAVGGAPQVEGPTGCDSDKCLMPEAGPGV
jgi:ribonucleotide reductase class II